MTCTPFRLADGSTGIMCGRGVRLTRCQCGREATRLCDARVPRRKSGTCDVPLCSRCSYSPATEVDYCPAHRIEARQGSLL